MKKDWELTPEAFDQLLDWLGPERESAGKCYEEIRQRLIKIFTARGCHTPDELADETFNRVSAKLPEIAPTYQGDRKLYFYGIANFIFREYTKVKPAPLPLPPPESAAEAEHQAQCLERCLQRLEPEQRQLVTAYYQYDKRAKIEHRRRLAEQYGLSDNALKIRVHRLRQQLFQYLCEGLEK
ncbi:MAG: sigma-70 family RNA polymerase sigma factor [Acidobacteria bacterium]|nr:sigma-70 family RNA polymerase sigma factor [Acidobacteriota bacterium]MBI3422152.1 sigma-70 family RNA polymerase sigma factor [Acidobacteriota bacterium]